MAAKMYVKETYIPVRRRKRRKRFPVAMIADDTDSSFYLFNALNADNIKKYKADQKYKPKKKVEPKKLQRTAQFDATPVDLKTVKENRKKNKKRETKRKKGVAAMKKYNVFQQEVKAFSDVTHSPNTTFDRLLHGSRKPLADKNSVIDVNHQIKNFNSGLLSPSHCLLMDQVPNRTSTPIFISPVFPSVTVRDKLRNIHNLTRGGRDNLLTPVLRNSTGSVENSPQQFSCFVPASDFTSSPSPHTTGETECLNNKIISAPKCEDNFISPISSRTRSSIENNINYKKRHASYTSNILSGIKMRLRRTPASENERHNNSDRSFNPDESFFSSVSVQRKRNKKTQNRCNKVESILSSSNSLSTISAQSKRTSDIECMREKTIGVEEIMSACISDERTGDDDGVCNKSNCNIDESIPSLFGTKHRRRENRSHTNSNDQNCGRSSSPLIGRSQRNKSGGSCVSVTSDTSKCAQLQFATTWESPDMFASVEQIETDVQPKYVSVVENYNSNFPTCNSNDEDTSGRNVSSSSTIRDSSHEYRGSCISPAEINGNSDVLRKSIGEKINLPSQVSNMVDLISSLHVGSTDSTIASLQSSDCDNVNELCAGTSRSLEMELDNGGSFKATVNKILLSDSPEVNKCGGSTRKPARSSSGATSVSSGTSHLGTCIPSHSDMGTANTLSQSAHREQSENVLSRAADSLESDDCKGPNVTHSLSLYCEENSERLNSTLSRRSSLCRRLSHVIIPERRNRERSNSNELLAVSHRRAPLRSVSIIIEDDELDPEVDTALDQELLSARDMLLGRCNQTEPLTFGQAFPERFFDNCKKIGEGLYGEVFFCQSDRGPGRVLKIIPIEGATLVNGEKQKKYNEVMSEVVIAMELSNLRHDAQFKTTCFVEVARCVCVKGKYPERLIDLWNEYNEEKVSENDPPTIFDDSQLFLIFELADGGKALESYCFTSAAQAFSAFVQLTFALAVAEVTLEFEHRDLHWGNVLVNKTPAKLITFKLNGEEFLVPSNGIQATVIDYTLSRMSYGGCCIFNDLAVDPDLFIAQGDYQFEVYRLMQSTVKNEWKDFRPYTNILWLHYTLGKMLQGVRYKNTSTKIHKKFRTKLTSCYNDVLKYNSAYELATNGNLLEMIK